MNPGSLARTKSSSGAVAVDMAIRNVDVYSPILKGSKLEPRSQHSVHCIPVLIVVVLFLLWVGSKDLDATPEKFVMRGATSTNLTATSDKLEKFHSNVNSLPKTKGVVNHVSSSLSNHGTPLSRSGGRKAITDNPT
ncbi:uncharacterized protein [Physcomitrium patens]|uniref:Uncharacterized protein n=1 Tax=Physcomitrium patens TaxID=3218 RepID=A0A2K1L016_PHYPA|nr:uncharacterized protein LOC112274144 isoform X1 [Physcomitrium patens]PNR59369.1 hypothetical protein PHYPA_002160 [Physcomitrium patens]|eukprot:XP_024359150.1 uncharacterized protein LOC112274144 isoform X1 [Physcomitrella patens]